MTPEEKALRETLQKKFMDAASPRMGGPLAAKGMYEYIQIMLRVDLICRKLGITEAEVDRQVNDWLERTAKFFENEPMPSPFPPNMKL